MSTPPLVIVGASLAGLTGAHTLRERGYDGPLVVLDAAAELPSDRPPLSKQVLAGTKTPDQAQLRVAERLDELDVDLRLGAAATAFDAASLKVTLADGSTIDAAGVLLATGASPRRLFDGVPGVHVLRTMADSLALRDALTASTDPSPRLAVIGAGFIGAEVAATARGMGVEVTMIEAAEVPMSRVLPRSIGSFVADLHRGHGVDVRLGVGVDELTPGSAPGGPLTLALSDGSQVRADVVLVGIGVVPDTAWLEGSGLSLSNGVDCDETLLAAPGVVAAGDIANWPNPRFGGETMRVEQWENAIESGEHAAGRLLAELGVGDAVAEPFSSIPWFWSDQYDRKLQMAGRPAAEDAVEIVEGSLEEQRFVALFRRGETCTGVLGVSRPRHVMQARMAMGESLDYATVRALFE